MVAFYVIGGLTAAWAVVLAALGIARHDFPATRAATAAVMATSAVLVAGSIGSGVIGSALEEEHGEEDAEAAEAEADAGAEDAAEAGAADQAAGGQPSGGGQEIELSAVPSGELAFDTTELEAEAGTVTLVMANPAPIPHNVSIEGDGVDREGETVGEGGTSTVSAELDRGEYTFYCSVPGHREGGMEGDLTVR